MGLGLSPLPKQRSGFSENPLPPGAYQGPSLWLRKLPCPSIIDKSSPLQSKCHCPFLSPNMHLTSPEELLTTHTADDQLSLQPGWVRSLPIQSGETTEPDMAPGEDSGKMARGSTAEYGPWGTRKPQFLCRWESAPHAELPEGSRKAIGQ